MNPTGQEIWGGFRPLRTVEDYELYRGWFTDTDEKLGPKDWACATAFKTGKSVPQRRVRITNFVGEEKVIIAAANPILDKRGHVVGSIGSNLDITALVKARKKLNVRTS